MKVGSDIICTVSTDPVKCWTLTGGTKIGRSFLWVMPSACPVALRCLVQALGSVNP